MTNASFRPTLVDLQSIGWPPDRCAAAVAVAGPNDVRIAAAALALLTSDDHVAGFAAWCDVHAARDAGSDDV